MRRHEIINVFTTLDQIFGKHSLFHNPMFLMYGPYNHQYNVLFHNNTNYLATDTIFKTHPFDQLPVSLELGLTNEKCELKPFSFEQLGRGNGVSIKSIVLLISILVFYFN